MMFHMGTIADTTMVVLYDCFQANVVQLEIIFKWVAVP